MPQVEKPACQGWEKRLVLQVGYSEMHVIGIVNEMPVSNLVIVEIHRTTPLPGMIQRLVPHFYSTVDSITNHWQQLTKNTGTPLLFSFKYWKRTGSNASLELKMMLQILPAPAE